MRKYDYRLYDFGGVRGFWIFNIQTKQPTSPTSLTVGLSVTDVANVKRTNLFEKGLVSVVSMKLSDSRIDNGSIMIDFFTGGISDWSFTRLTIEDTFEKKTKLFSVRDRNFRVDMV